MTPEKRNKAGRAFLITALSCNRHQGWDPSLHDRLPHHECCGPDKNGDAFVHVLKMVKVLREAGLPITWFIDPPVAREHLDFFEKGREHYGDEIALMPSSYSHFNSVNYNTEKSYEETLELLRGGAKELEEIFQTPVRTVAVDQFIGSVGSNFTRAAAALDMDALWGVGLDHFTCDTSMFHGGCPWNPYRPSKNDFRIPGDDPLRPWIFQWTFRDLINSARVPGGASGAVMFSTDVDDVIASNIAKNQPDYYHRLARELLKNRKDNDALVMTIHQEDHDSWRDEGVEYYRRFFSNLPEEIEAATMSEVAAALNEIYPDGGEASQTLRLEDPLLCKDDVVFIHEDILKPTDWPVGGETYPPHVFHYDAKRQLIYEEGSHAPLRYIDYSKKYTVPEEGTYPPEVLPEIEMTTLEETGDGFGYELISDGDFQGYPLAFWTKSPAPHGALKLPGGFVIFVSLKKGCNKGVVKPTGGRRR